jgi:mannose-1-phosphate guanylyltransferase/mannose-6-phosphate isomerase
MAASPVEPQSAPDVDPQRYAIVLAGGSGTRLWPLSRSSMPKQLLALNGQETLLQQTARRIAPKVKPSCVLTVTHLEHRFEVAGQLYAVNPELANGVLAESIGRNTLPAIAWASARIAKSSPNALIGVFSSDHAVTDDDAFQCAWAAAETAAQAGYLVLFGMQPTKAATGYGYIHALEPLADLAVSGGMPVLKVKRFVEKPDQVHAEAYLAAGGYYWNGGMFVFRADVFLSMLKQAQPAVHAALPALAEAPSPAPAELYQSLPEISIDYGLLERAERVAVVPVSMGWSDLGSWEAIYESRGKDACGNVTHGKVITLESENNLLWTEHGLLATLGVQNLAVVQTRDATLVCPRDRVADLKGLVARVKQSDAGVTENHLTVTRPWGSYTILEDGPNYKTKRIMVKPGAKLSMQMHHHRAEHWVVISGTAKIMNGEQEMFLEENQSTYIPKTHRHRLENPGKIPLQIIEIQTGPYLEEDDIVRFGDMYGRA